MLFNQHQSRPPLPFYIIVLSTDELKWTNSYIIHWFFFKQIICQQFLMDQQPTTKFNITIKSFSYFSV